LQGRSLRQHFQPARLQASVSTTARTADWVEDVRFGAISETLKNNAAPPDQQQLYPQEQAQLALA
jgi:hypothetical protein